MFELPETLVDSRVNVLAVEVVVDDISVLMLVIDASYCRKLTPLAVNLMLLLVSTVMLLFPLLTFTKLRLPEFDPVEIEMLP
jgi:hypothetical protein